MAAEKKGTKGRFLYLFDWHAKSRKKLFSTKFESSGGSNQEKENLGSSTLPFLLGEDCFGEDGYPTRGSENYFCRSTVNEDDSYGTKAPGVVARLMGLESLPAPAAGETSSISSHDYESHAPGNPYYPRNLSGYQHDHHTSNYSYTGSKLGGYHWNSLDYKSSVAGGRPIERFQNEVLPPKSAKPISITHHKLLSPIKSPGFIPTNDAAYMMEAVARIIDPTPRETSRMRSPNFGSSSDPIKIRDSKDKMEASHRLTILPESSKKTKRSPSTNHGNSRDRNHLGGNSRDRLADKSLSRTFDLERSGACSSITRGKAVPSVFDGKDNVHRKNMSTYFNSRKVMPREHNQVNLKHSSNSETSAKKRDCTRNSANRSSGKQNDKSKTDNVTSKYSDPSRPPRRSIPIDGSSGSSKGANKTSRNPENVSQKVSSAAVATEKRSPLKQRKNFSRSKDLLIKGKQVKQTIVDDLLVKKNGMAAHHGIALQNVADQKDIDVISFTFNSPIKKPAYFSHSCKEMTGSSSGLDSEYRGINDEFDPRNPGSSLSRLTLIGSEDLSLLLEQKLKELTNKVQLHDSLSDSGKEGTDVDSVPNCSDLVSRRIAVQANSNGHVATLCESDSYSVCSEEIEGEVSSSSTNKFYREGHHLGDNNSSAPRCFSAGSCISPDMSDCSYGNSQAFSLQSEEETSCTFSNEFHPVEDERSASDTTSSYYDEWDGKYASISQSVSQFSLDNWELQYVKQIIQFAGLKGSLLSRSREIIDSSVFDEVENLINMSSANAVGDCGKLRRKLVFDSLNENLCLSYESISKGGYKAYCRWRLLLQKEDWLVEELCKEVLCLLDMGNLLVDEVVEKDMGTQYSGWLAFEVETLELGIDFEMDLVDSLINEIVNDLSFFYMLPNRYTYPIYLDM